MATLQVQKIPKHSYKLIAVPSERMELPVSDYKEIESEGKKYKIAERVTINKNEKMPTLLTLLSAGISLEYVEIWSAFRGSDKIVFFICEKL